MDKHYLTPLFMPESIAVIAGKLDHPDGQTPQAVALAAALRAQRFSGILDQGHAVVAAGGEDGVEIGALAFWTYIAPARWRIWRRRGPIWPSLRCPTKSWPMLWKLPAASSAVRR